MIKNASIKYLITIINVLVLYAFTGFLGLSFLSTSPGFATPVWIPSGIALGCALIWGLRTLPGVFLGSLFLNYYVAMHLPHAETDFSLSLLVGIIIATGAVLQTIAGWFMIKKMDWIKKSSQLSQCHSLFCFFIRTAFLFSQYDMEQHAFINFKYSAYATIFLFMGNVVGGDSIGILILRRYF